MGKKRKYELDLDVERTMYSSFVAAANSVSQLYTQAVQQQRRAAVTASRGTLERVLAFVLRDPQGGDQISRSLLVQFLQHEYENLEHQDLTGPPAPVQLLPFMGPGVATPREGSAEPHHTPSAGAKPPRSGSGPRQGGMNTRDWLACSNMDDQHTAAAAAAAAAAGGGMPSAAAAAAASGACSHHHHQHPQQHQQQSQSMSDMEEAHPQQQQQQAQGQAGGGMFMPMGNAGVAHPHMTHGGMFMGPLGSLQGQ